MTTRIAIWLFILIAALFGADLHFGWGGTLTVLQGLSDVIYWLTFWR